MKKNWISVILVGVLLITLLPTTVMAAKLPNQFWGINDNYAAAKDNGDDNGIIQYGEATINLLSGLEETQQIKEILASRYYDVADAYDRAGNFPSAAYYYERYIPYGEFMNWTDGVKIAKAKAAQYRPTVQAYTKAVQPQKYYGSRNEPQFGTLMGQISETSQVQESMVLLYINFGDMPNDWDHLILKQARERKQAVEIAWNIQGEGSALWGIPSQGSYVNDFLNVLNQYADVPMYLRIGAEMNIWGDKPDPQAFQTAFRFLADAVHQRTRHVATVWSVAHASEWNTKMEDFYPGDAYVDWVGISAYLIRHFQGQEWPVDMRFNEVCFSAGDAADPVMVVKEAVEKFGDRKPIMLSECGSAHKTVSMGRDNTDWAVNNLKRMYWFVPMVYPQVKLIAYFNTYVAPETNDYALSHNSAMQSAYQSLIGAPHFIRNYGDSASQTYQPVTNHMVFAQKQTPLYTYPHIFGDDKPTVRYSLDGNTIGQADEAPYLLNYNFANTWIGEHTLKVEVLSKGSVVTEANYTLWVTENIPVEVNGKELISDTVAMMENDRVLVPMRTIFETLGAVVSWDDATQTAKAVKGGVTLEITIDQKELRKNGTVIVLDTPARIINGRTMVPVRAVSEALQAKVNWVEAENKVTVTTD
ncbi:MAG: hypothetical protein IJD97_01810 [Clostridia bacterium]|nr:hypothetical protein [Clostridia bacterium]MBQ2940950.1 hypothetical protein [Clostridia bacterium]